MMIMRMLTRIHGVEIFSLGSSLETCKLNYFHGGILSQTVYFKRLESRHHEQRKMGFFFLEMADDKGL